MHGDDYGVIEKGAETNKSQAFPYLQRVRKEN